MENTCSRQERPWCVQDDTFSWHYHIWTVKSTRFAIVQTSSTRNFSNQVLRPIVSHRMIKSIFCLWNPGKTQKTVNCQFWTPSKYTGNQEGQKIRFFPLVPADFCHPPCLFLQIRSSLEALDSMVFFCTDSSRGEPNYLPKINNE